MIQSDYIMQIIDRLGAALRRVVRARSGDDETLPMSLVHETYEEIFGLDDVMLSMLDIDTLVSMCKRDDLPYLAHWMRHEYEQHMLAGDTRQAAVVGGRALRIFAIATEDGALPETVIEDVRALLADGVLVAEASEIAEGLRALV